MPKDQPELPIIPFPTAAAWEQWIIAQPKTSDGLWLKFAKKTSGIETVSKPEAIDVALCHGWIDGQLKPFDDDYWLIRFTPRRPKSKWSAINRDRAMALVEEGRMCAGGHAEIERARQDGRWNAAYVSQGKATVPDDLQRALDASGEARDLFKTLDSANRYAVLYRVETAKDPQKRALVIDKLVSMLARGDTIHPRRKKQS